MGRPRLSKFRVSVGGYRLGQLTSLPNPQPMSVAFPSRRFLEWSVRHRVRAIPNVTILEGHDLTGLTATADRDRVTGVRTVSRGSGTEGTLTADLVVDATGRGSRTPIFLEELGYGRPPQDELMVHLAYACQSVRIAPSALDAHMIAVTPSRAAQRCSLLSDTKTTPGCLPWAPWQGCSHRVRAPRCSISSGFGVAAGAEGTS